MEQLSKSQIVLLTLLVSFVTSIATGIVTVSLMDQAPPVVAQTVNRIVERTVEKVTPASLTAATGIIQEKTIIVKEADLISQALARANPSVVRIFTTSSSSPAFLGMGIVIDAAGTIVSDSNAFDTDVGIAELADGSRVRVSLASRNATTSIAFFDSATTTTDGKSITWSPIAIEGTHPTLGTTIIALAGKTVARIASGIVTTLISSSDKEGPQIIDTDIPADSILAGSPLITTEGNLLGLRTGVARLVSPSGFISASVLIQEEEKKEEETKKQEGA